MAYNLIVTDSAESDLDHILSYIINELSSPQAAFQLIDEIENCYQLLRLHPEMFTLSDMPELVEKDYRRAIIKNYILVYKVNEPDQTVTIHRFFHGKQNYNTLI